MKSEKTYINLLKKSVCDIIYDETPERHLGHDHAQRAHTMIGIQRLNNIQLCIEDVIKNNVSGHFIETGVWRGGACIFAKGIFNIYNQDERMVYVADSFRGLPKPNESCIPDKADGVSTLYLSKELAISLETVKSNFEKYELLDDNVIFLEGWFKDTLPKIPIETKFSIIRLDGDMYDSTMDALNNLYSKLNIGGYCIIDDYGCIKACSQAVTDFREKNNITEPLIEIDWTGMYWKKEN